MPMSKYIRVAVEGATTDGRVIERQHIQEIADSFNPQMFGARVFLEHIKGLAPDSQFGAYGDVMALKAEDIKDGPLAGKLGLYAQIDATDALVELNKKRQKIYSSIEFNPLFADTGGAYLTSLSFTDNPASLGTEILMFCANSQTNPLTARKTDPACLFTAALEVAFELEEASGTTGTIEPGRHFFSRITELLTGGQKKFSQETGELRQAVELIAESQRDVLEKTECFSALQQENAALKQQIDGLSTSLTDMKQQLETQDGSFSQRPPASGGDQQSNIVLADC
ncbi:GPO family capsid scaffolding protein [Brenneria uluponensis]|uniref:GPO family capsid scaffolding protein n=1 Tax=Brenneria uluponensis TaxID=3057057 RepID=UPI0028EFAB6F|nr:GPO family capsid scaffolding protein [Brenneria ulupoensis]